MNVEEQKAGEGRVQELVISPLLKRGLTKPTTLTKVAFEEMLSEMRAMLAYMSAESLEVLREDISAHPCGPNKDRFPILNKILEMSRKVQPPKDTGSPLVRRVLKHVEGEKALLGGYAVELINDVKLHRRFPTAWGIKTVREAADDNVRKFRRLKSLEAMSDVDREWFNRRSARIAQLQKWREEELRGAEVDKSEVGQ